MALQDGGRTGVLLIKRTGLPRHATIELQMATANCRPAGSTSGACARSTTGDLNPDLVPTRNAVSEEDEMSWSEDSEFLYCSWSPLQPETFAFAGSAGFGLTEKNILT